MGLVLKLPLRYLQRSTRKDKEVGVQQCNGFNHCVLVIEMRELRRAEADAFLARS